MQLIKVIFIKQQFRKIILTFFSIIITSTATPALAGTAFYQLENGQQEVHQYTINSVTKNRHGIILEVVWDNGIESTYYLGRSGDLRVDDGNYGTWSYNSTRNAIVLNVSKVGKFVLELGTESYQSIYYWDEPADGCRNMLTGEFVSGHLCR